MYIYPIRLCYIGIIFINDVQYLIIQFTNPLSLFETLNTISISTLNHIDIYVLRSTKSV